MAYVLKRRSLFMTGHSYATGMQYRFFWSSDETKARRFADDDPSVDTFSRMTGARIEHRPNTRAELREIGCERMRIRGAGHQPASIHTRINQRAKGSM